MFLMLSDIHFDPYADPAVIERLGAKPLPPCQTPAAPAVANFGSDTNYPLLQSALDHAAATAVSNHFHYDYVLVAGDFLAHQFDKRYQQCVGGGPESYRKFVSDTIRFVDGIITKALPGVPVFAALGNNDSDAGDYAEPSKAFLASVGSDWSRGWGKLSPEARAGALASFGGAGNYAVPHPTVPNRELVVLNSNLWAARHPRACGETDPDPDGQFQWLEEVLGTVKRGSGAATLILHIPPGMDALRSTLGPPAPLWTDACTQRLTGELMRFRGLVTEIYAGHSHRDDFRLLPDAQGAPLCVVHIVPAISPVFLNNPAMEIGWYDQSTGALSDYATLYLDLREPNPTWATEYVFTQAYQQPRPGLEALEDLSQVIRAGNPNSGVGEEYATYYGAGVRLFITSDNWRTYSCAQTEMTASQFAQCKRDGAITRPHPPGQ
jgi:hypothetical protein